MSDNVEVVRRAMDAFNRGDLDAVIGSFSQDFEFDFSNSRGPMRGIYRGRDQVQEFFESFSEPWASFGFDLQEEVIELPDGRVLTVNTFRARGHESGADVAASGASVWTVGDGEVKAWTFYQSKSEALEAAGA
jgi:ketosteroid isomerase-like protein